MIEFFSVERIFLIHLFVASFMTGLVWFVQLIHYPLFSRVGVTSFPEYEKEHTLRAGMLIAPTMFIEFISAFLLIFISQEWQNWFILNAGLLTLIWMSTFLIQVPLHQKLSRSFHEGNVYRLCRSNWIRTALWSARSIILLYLLSTSFFFSQ